MCIWLLLVVVLVLCRSGILCKGMLRTHPWGSNKQQLPLSPLVLCPCGMKISFNEWVFEKKKMGLTKEPTPNSKNHLHPTSTTHTTILTNPFRCVKDSIMMVMTSFSSLIDKRVKMMCIMKSHQMITCMPLYSDWGSYPSRNHIHISFQLMKGVW